jgi:predicted Zn-dependent protease
MNATGYGVSAYKDLLHKIKESVQSNQANVLAKTHPRVDDRIELVEHFEKKHKVTPQDYNKERFIKYVQN